MLLPDKPNILIKTIGFILLTLVHILVPALCVLFFDAPAYWLPGAVLFILAVMATLHRSSAPPTLVLVSLLSFASTLAALLLATSYYVQGEGFNSQFFYHLDFQTLGMARRGYGGLYYVAVLFLCLALVVPLLLRRYSSRPRQPIATLVLVWVVALTSNYPLISYVNYQRSTAQAAIGSFAGNAELTQIELAYLRSLGGKAGALRNKNIILIYAESLEQLYFDKHLFGADLMPNLRRLSRNAQNFTDMRQVPGASATITGIVASQCGFPVKLSSHLATNSTMASADNPYAGESCLADILWRNNYQTVFMGGAPLAFAGKGKFLKAHGYSEIYGENSLSQKLIDPDYVHSWGLYDDSLFDFAREKLAVMEAGGKPYFLTLLTLDTHHPDGFLARACERLDGLKEQMANAIYCSDQLISRFITDALAMTDPEDTIVVLFSDHLSMRNTLWSKLQSRANDRRLNFMIFNGDEGRSLGVAGTHFDVAPTILEAAGLPGNLKVGLGQSLFYKSQQRNDLDIIADHSNVPSLLNTTISARDAGISFSYKRMSLTVGDQEFKASSAGEEFSSGMFLLVFDDRGVPEDAIYSQDYATLAKNIEGRFVAGISIFADRPDKPSYFFGPVTRDGGKIKQRPLYRDVELSTEEVISGMEKVSVEQRPAAKNGL